MIAIIIGVCEKTTPLDKKTGGQISFQKTKSGAGSQLMSPDCRARACAKGSLLSQTPVAFNVELNIRNVLQALLSFFGLLLRMWPSTFTDTGRGKFN